MRTPAEIAALYAEQFRFDRVASREMHSEIYDAIREAIEADRAQRGHWDAEIYIVQDDTGNVVDVFRDANEASAAYQCTAPGLAYSIIQESAWEPGEYAEQRIRTLRAEFDAATGDRSADYSMSEDDWRVGLSGDEAAEIARLIAWQEAQK